MLLTQMYCPYGAQSASTEQPVQVMFTQTSPLVAPRWRVARQLPARQEVPTQRWLAPHWVSLVQSEQLSFRQTLPPVHSLLVLWQLPATQALPTQMLPLP